MSGDINDKDREKDCGVRGGDVGGGGDHQTTADLERVRNIVRAGRTR